MSQSLRILMLIKPKGTSIMVNFADILSKRTSEIEKPRPLPVGTYLCSNPQLPNFETIGQNESPAAVFTFTILQPTEDVDQDDLREYSSTQGEIRGKTLRHTMYLTERSLYRTKQEVTTAFGMNEDEDLELGELFNNTVNKTVLVKVKHRPSKDGTEIYNEVESLAAA